MNDGFAGRKMTRAHHRGVWLTALFVAGLARGVLAIEFDDFGPDKSGRTNCAPALTKALYATTNFDRVLHFSPGIYTLSEPVYLLPRVTLIGGPGPVVIRGDTRQTDLLHTWKNHGNSIKGISFEHCYKVLTCEGNGFFASANVEDCSFTDCWAGLDFPSIQLVSFNRCSFASCRYGIRGQHGPAGRANGVNLNQCSFLKIGEWAVQIEGGPTAIRDSIFEYSDGGGVYLMDAMSALIEGCRFEAMAITGHWDIAISAAQIFNGVVSVRGNQFMEPGPSDRILVKGQSGVHIYDNFAHVEAGANLIRNNAERSEVRVEGNFLESRPASQTMKDEVATTRAAAVVRAKAVADPEKLAQQATYPDVQVGERNRDIVTCKLTPLDVYRCAFKVGQVVGKGGAVKEGDVVQVIFALERSPTPPKLLPAQGAERLLYLESIRGSPEYRAFKMLEQ